MPTKDELGTLAVRAAVTFLQVFLATLIGANVFDVGGADAVSALSASALAGIGAALSIIYNYLTNLGQRLEGKVG